MSDERQGHPVVRDFSQASEKAQQDFQGLV